MDSKVPIVLRGNISGRHARRTDSACGLLLGLGLFAFYVTVQYGDFLGWDGRTVANVTHNLLEHGRLVVTHDVPWWVPEFPGDRSPFGIGMSLVLLPFWAVQRAVDPAHGYWLTVANPMITAANAVVLYRMGLALGWRRRSALVTALAFGLLTMAPAYTVELFNEPAVGLCLTVAVLAIVRLAQGRAGAAWMLGTAVAVACLFRYESYLLVVPLVAVTPFVVGLGEWRRTWRGFALPLLGPTGITVAWTLWYNAYRTGSPFELTSGGPFSTPIWQGVSRQLLSSGKGFFWYNLLLLAGIPGLVLLWRRNRTVTVVVASLFLLRVGYFARYWNPDGDVAWGPRYLVPLCPLLALGVGEVVEWSWGVQRVVRTRVWWALGVLAVAGAVVTLASLWVPYTRSHSVINDIPGWRQLPAAQVDGIRQQHVARQYDDWRWSPIVLNLRSLDDASRYPPGFPLRWWRTGSGGRAVGAGTLALSVTALSAAAAIAAAADRRQRRAERATAARNHPPPAVPA